MKRTPAEVVISEVSQEASIIELENLLKLVRSDPEHATEHLSSLVELAELLLGLWQRPSA